MLIFFKILQAGFIQAIQALWINKLRSFLSILGICIGIFCVITVLMMVDSVKQNISHSFARLGNDVIFVTRESWDGDPETDWWKYLKRPYPSYRDFLAIQEKVAIADKVTIRIFLRDKELSYRKFKADNLFVIGCSQEFGNVYNMEIVQGRYFTPLESQVGNNVIILGAKVAQALFENINDPIDREVEFMGRKVKVIGIIKKEGQSILGDGFDNLAFLPYNYLRSFIDVNSDAVMPLIGVKAQKNIPLEQLKDELRGVMRTSRKLLPVQEDNFSLNQISLLTSFIDGIFAIVNTVGWLIGLFSILVGGFGIANIMFVSVKEQTGIIGIKKSLGAKSYFILFEFLIEAICLSIIGGLVGLILVYAAAKLGNQFIDSFDIVLSPWNISLAILMSMIIGIISGFIPALKASKMNPVEAIRHTI